MPPPANLDWRRHRKKALLRKRYAEGRDRMRGMEFLLLASANLATGINCVLSAIDVTFVFLACRDTCTRKECLACSLAARYISNCC